MADETRKPAAKKRPARKPPATAAAKRAAADAARAAAVKPPAAPPADPPADERGATKRVVVKRERVLVLPEGVTVEALGGKDAEGIRRVLGIKGGRAHADAHVEAWVVCGEFEGDKRDAIKAFAGEPGSPDAKPGTYRAPSASAWRGGRHYERPERPKVEAKDID
jgi:hypothetical protein